MTEMDERQGQKVLDCRSIGEANGLLYAHHFKNIFFKYITDDPLRAEQLKARIFNDNGDTSAPLDIPTFVQRAIDVLYDDH